MATAIEPKEILTEIHVPVAQRRSGSAYLKMAQPASGFANVGVAVALRVDTKGCCEEVGIGVTGFCDQPFRARAGSALAGQQAHAEACRGQRATSCRRPRAAGGPSCRR
jgi:carbon-monoxide dehydrogenase medium subunit